jgi:hypothetical protein
MQRLRRPFLEWFCNFGLAPSVNIAQLVLAGVFERHPSLKIFFAETRLGWVPFWLEHPPPDPLPASGAREKLTQPLAPL